MPETIEISKDGRVVTVRLNRPKQLNALSSQVLQDFLDHVVPLDSDPSVGCIVVTGNERAFAAGADIKEMAGKSGADMAGAQFFADWTKFANMNTPKIAAVNGFALGGGCELAMMCDFIIAGKGAKFGQPEIKLGVIAGIGGTQRMTRLIGRAKSMDLHLTGRMMGATEALECGLIARMVDDDAVVSTAQAAAAEIANYSKPATADVLRTIYKAEDVTLADGLAYERDLFYARFDTDDQKEGMSAFVEKRTPTFKGT